MMASDGLRSMEAHIEERIRAEIESENNKPITFDNLPRRKPSIAEDIFDTPEPDPLASPSHYKQGSIEPIEYIKAQGWLAPYCCGNIIKYVTRYPFKDGLKDLKKARVYLDWLIEEEES